MHLYVNGEFVTKEEASVSPFDHGFMYGLGLFETFRTYNGHPFLLDDHFQRLHESADEMNIRLHPYRRGEVVKIINRLLELNGLTDGYIRWNVSAGPGEIGLTTDPYETPSTIVFIKPLPGAMPDTKKASTLSVRRNSPEGAQRLKSHHYFNNILGKREAEPGTEGIFLTEDGVLSEGIVSNLFWVKGGRVFTPDLTCGCLNGITRQFLIRLFEKKGLPVYEGRYELEEAMAADEVILTNSIQEAVAVNEWDDSRFPGSEGKFFRMVQAEYRDQTKHLWSREAL